MGTSFWRSVPRVDPLEPSYEFVYRVIRRGVLSGALPPGTRLTQTEVAERLAVSTTPVREAFRRLASESLIDTVPGRGAMVHALTVDEWNEIVAMRAVLEPLALRRAAERISGRALATMERIHELMTREEETATWVDMNRRFHRVYYDAAESPRLRSVLTTLHDAATTYVAEGVREQPALPVQGNREHAAIIKGLREQDFNALQSVIATHISTTLSLPHQRPAD